MGNICFGSKPEERKQSAFHDASEPEVVLQQDAAHAPADSNNRNNNAASNAIGSSSLPTAGTPLEEERIKALREEQTRLQLIVQTTGRSMVAVRSTRGSTGYYDQGFAAALSQHLEQTTQFPDHLPSQLPPVPTDCSSDAAKEQQQKQQQQEGEEIGDSAVYSRLSQAAWQGIDLGDKGSGLAGCAGENPHTYMDHLVESYLDAMIPKKERLFSGTAPIVENLL